MDVMRKIFGLLFLVVCSIILVPQSSEAKIYMGKNNAIVVLGSDNLGSDRWDAFYKECLQVMDMGFIPYQSSSAKDSYSEVYILFHRAK
jgi:hypothetical protein